MLVEKYFCGDKHPYDEINWIKHDAVIKDEKGKIILEKKDLEFPDFWSENARNIFAKLYFRDEEKSLKEVIERIVWNIALEGIESGYFQKDVDPNKCEGTIFGKELTYLLVNQYGAFNSPVWFNLGRTENPILSACFLLDIEDNMESILNLVDIKGQIYRMGAGTGVNYSTLRPEGSPLSKGGSASGPLSFMKGYNSFAGVIKSGGLRRSAHNAILSIDHPDIEKFIESKVSEDKKAKTLIEMGYNPIEAYDSVQFQNQNNTILLTDEFMFKVENGDEESVNLLMKIAKANWECGDPGVMFYDTINKWNTCKSLFDIEVSNPCSEFIFKTNSACNLSSLNLLKFKGKLEDFKRAINVFAISQDIIIDISNFPTKEIDKNSKSLRPIGLGYSNLGALIMSYGNSYESINGRNLATNMSEVMTLNAWKTSCDLAKKVGSFEEYNESNVIEILEKHKSFSKVRKSQWDELIEDVKKYGVRNAVVTCLAPTGSISWIMDCETTSQEPYFNLTTVKELDGGGKIESNQKVVLNRFKELGYDDTEIKNILKYKEEGRKIVWKDENHAKIFETANDGLSWEAHIKMLEAIQPFVSMSISKTVNLPNNSKPEDVYKVYYEAWKRGIKCVTVYRDGAKWLQPLGRKEREKKARRKHLADTRQSITHKFTIGGHDGYMTVGLYENGQPGELFIVLAKVGSTVGGLIDAFASTFSMALQYGVPLKKIVSKLKDTKFEPEGFTGNKEIPMAKSIMDYIMKWMEKRFLEHDDVDEISLSHPFCPQCGSQMIKTGTCYSCSNCGYAGGCG